MQYITSRHVGAAIDHAVGRAVSGRRAVNMVAATEAAPGAEEASRASRRLAGLGREFSWRLFQTALSYSLGLESKVPRSFSKGDETVDWHEMGHVVGCDGQVDAWMALERRDRLLAALLEHLSHDVEDTNQTIKDKIRDAITDMRGSQAARISVIGLHSLVFTLAENLDVTMAARTVGGNCDVCSRIADEVVI